MKKIGIITFHNAHNYGAMLQAYALQQKLLSYNYDVKIIDYQNEKILNDYKFGIQISPNFFSTIKSIANYVLFKNVEQKRYLNFENFISEKMILSPKVTEQQLKEKCEFDIIIAGSDQIWNPEITNGLSDIYTLNFGNGSFKKISYAASIGNVSAVETYANEFKLKISQLDQISVREETAKIALQKLLTNRLINVVLDPTMLLEKNQWEKCIENCKPEKEKYILSYMLQKNKEQIKIVQFLSKQTGFKVIHFEKMNKYKILVKSAYSSGPLVFLNLIKNAEYIVSDSFHATVFSIIFHKKMWIVPHSTRGSRIIDLLNKLQLSERIITSFSQFRKKQYNQKIDYNIVDDILQKEVKKSEDWLISAIENDQNEEIIKCKEKKV